MTLFCVLELDVTHHHKYVSVVYSVNCALHTVQCTMYIAQSASKKNYGFVLIAALVKSTERLVSFLRVNSRSLSFLRVNSRSLSFLRVNSRSLSFLRVNSRSLRQSCE